MELAVRSGKRADAGTGNLTGHSGNVVQLLPEILMKF